MVLNILLAAAMWVVGLFLYSIGIMQVMITLFCAIPLTKRFSAIYPVDTSGIYKKCATTIILWAVISAVVVFLVMHFGNFYAKCGFWIGVAIPFLLSLGKWGINPDNISDYFKTFHRYYPKNALVEIFNAK